MEDFKGNELASNILGVLYINKYDYKTKTIEVIHVIGFTNPGACLNAYANTRNPESTMAAGKTREEFELELEKLHERLNNPEWVAEMEEYL